MLGSSFAGYVPLAFQNPHPIIVYSVANYRPHLSHFWANVIVISLRTECNASRLLSIKTTTGTIFFKLRIFLFSNPCLPELSFPRNPENVRPHSSNSTKNAIHYNQPSCENATPSSGTSPVAFYWEVSPGPPPPSPPPPPHTHTHNIPYSRKVCPLNARNNKTD